METPVNQAALVPPQFPHYAPPQGIPPAAHPKQAAVLMKAVKSMARVMGRKLPGAKSQKRGLTSRDTVNIKRRKVKFY